MLEEKRTRPVSNLLAIPLWLCLSSNFFRYLPKQRMYNSLRRLIVSFCVVSIVLFFPLNDLHGQAKEIIEKPVVEWNSRDCLIVCLSVIQHNLYNNTSPIMVIATPYYPSVIMAMKRIAQIEQKWSADQFFYETDTLGKDCLGLHLDGKTTKFIDHDGHCFSNFLQLDSLTLLLSLSNRGWPSQPPDISNLENNIFLVNDESAFMRPIHVWGRRHNMLLREEKLLVVFQLRSEDYHFLQHSSNMYLAVRGLPENIFLKFPLSEVK